MSWRAIVGLGLILAGGGYILDQAGIFDFGELVSTWWPMIIVLVGVIQLLTRSVPVLAGIIVVAVGAALQVSRLEIVDIDLGAYLWPLVLIVIGAYLLASRSRTSGPHVTDENRLNSFVIFGGVDQKLESTAFEGGSAVALFGGSDFDLRDCKLGPAGAELELTAAFGGIELTVPTDWRVQVSGLPIFGGLSNKTTMKDSDDKSAPALNVRGAAAFGAIEVHN